MKKKAVMNWSGGKDSALALHRLLQTQEFAISRLLTTVNQVFSRVSMHGVRVDLLEKQAESLGFPLRKIALPETVSMQAYGEIMRTALFDLKKEGIEYAIFGDIFLEDLKTYREKQLSQIPMQGIFPIWQGKPERLMHEFLDLGFKAITVCVNDMHLDQSFVGRLIDHDFVRDLPKNVDICGENGEYHSFVFDGPIFKKPIVFEKGGIVRRNFATDSKDDEHQGQKTNWLTGFWYQDLW